MELTNLEQVKQELIFEVEKRKKDNKIVSIYPNELTETNDKVTSEELKIITDSIIKKNKHNKTRKNTLKKCKNHFKK